MAPRAKKKAQNAKSTTSKRNKPRRSPPASSLDAAGLAYAKLIADPCNSPLVHPVYSGTEGGYLFRAESFFTLGTGAGTTAGVFHWIPGSANTTNTNLICVESASGVTGAATTYQGAQAPGITFLKSNASNFRCVAACVKVSYPGGESSRGGRVHFGQTSGSFLNIGGGTYVPDEVANGLTQYTRTPAQEIELIWKPNDADQLFADPGAVSSGTDSGRRGALTVTFAGLPTSVGLTFRMTAVYEWQPVVNRGVSTPNLSKSPSSNTLDHVVNFLIDKGFKFVNGVASSNPLASGLISGISNAFGIMPATRMTTNRIQWRN